MLFQARSRRALGLLTAIALMAPAALADVSDVIVEFTATSIAGSGVYAVRESDGHWEGDTFYWRLEEPVNITDGNEVIATIRTDGPGTAIQIHNDPQIALDFSVQAGFGTTSFTIQSTLLSFDTINDAIGRATTGITVTDFLGGGAELVGQNPAGGAYLAQYNGFVPGGTTFAESISSLSAGPNSSAVGADTVPLAGYNLIGAPVSSMSSQFSFTLSSMDLASGTSFFEIVPEPASFALMAIGAVLLRRRA